MTWQELSTLANDALGDLPSTGNSRAVGESSFIDELIYWFDERLWRPMPQDVRDEVQARLEFAVEYCDEMLASLADVPPEFGTLIKIVGPDKAVWMWLVGSLYHAHYGGASPGGPMNN